MMILLLQGIVTIAICTNLLPCSGFILPSKVSYHNTPWNGCRTSNDRADTYSSRIVIPRKAKDIDTEDLVTFIEKADCAINESTISSSRTSAATVTPDNDNDNDNDVDDAIVNGTPSRVRQNIFGKVSDSVSASVFSLLHVNDKLGIKDSSKNLRVLWSRSYLNQIGKMKDEVAYELLPEKTRDIVKLLPKNGPLVDFQEFIVSRTEFIDSAVESFLRGVTTTTTTTTTTTPTMAVTAKKINEDETSKYTATELDNAGTMIEQNHEKTDLQPLPQIVLFGAGYDTRSLRYNGKANFFEVDLPHVVDGKGRLQSNWKSQQQQAHQTGDDHNDIILPTRIGYDLNDAADATKPKLTQVLADAGLRPDIPTMFVWEAVLFYVQPEAVMKIFDDVFRYGNESTYCLVDSLVGTKNAFAILTSYYFVPIQIQINNNSSKLFFPILETGCHHILLAQDKRIVRWVQS